MPSERHCYLCHHEVDNNHAASDWQVRWLPFRHATPCGTICFHVRERCAHVVRGVPSSTDPMVVHTFQPSAGV